MSPPAATLHRIEVHAVDHCNLACPSCNHLSPHLAKRTYAVAEYLPWLERLRDAAAYPYLCISGGEPTLHPDLPGFVAALHAGRFAPHLQMATNLRWLRTADDLDRMAPVLDRLDALIVSYYPPVVAKAGGQAAMRGLVDAAAARFGLRIDDFSYGREIDRFWTARFHDEPKPVARLDCGTKHCTQLVPEGVLYRCPFGHGLRSPVVPDGFKRAEGMAFDLRGDGPIDPAALAAWANRYPFGNCHHCGCATGDGFAFRPWSSDPRRRAFASPAEYDADITSLPILDEVPFEPARVP